MPGAWHACPRPPPAPERHQHRSACAGAGALDVLARLLLQDQAAFRGVLQAAGATQAAAVAPEGLLGMFLDLWLDRCCLLPLLRTPPLPDPAAWATASSCQATVACTAALSVPASGCSRGHSCALMALQAAFACRLEVVHIEGQCKLHTLALCQLLAWQCLPHTAAAGMPGNCVI